MACGEAVGSRVRVLPTDLERVLGPSVMLSAGKRLAPVAMLDWRAAARLVSTSLVVNS
jgi:hypothetical protein